MSVAADQLFERILRSLKENSAEFVREKHARRNAKIRLIAYACAIFASGGVVGALLVKVL